MKETVFDPANLVGMPEDTSEESSTASRKDLLEATLTYIGKWYRSKRNSFQRLRMLNSQDVIEQEPQPTKTGFQDLPTDAQIHILSFLDVISLCRASQVCTTWSILCNDGLLWEKKLKRDSKMWDVIDHLSHPDLYRETAADLTPREIYLNCCPECRRHREKSNLRMIHLPRISFYLGLSVPRIVMFGPGLESNTSSIVKKILWDERSPFTVKGMFPGQFEGVGSGVCLQFDGGQLNLITLYATTKSERERAAAEGRERRSKLVRKRQIDVDLEAGEMEEEEDEPEITVTQPVRELCSTVDAFIYIVDSTQEDNKVDLGNDEFNAMMKNRWLPPKAPLLVLSCVPDATVSSCSSISVADTLGLRELNRSWQVRACHVSSLYGFVPGVRWLLQQVMNS